MLISVVTFLSYLKCTLGNPIVQIQSYRRLAKNATYSYLKYHLDGEGNPTHLAFNGTEDDPNTSRYPAPLSTRVKAALEATH